MCQELLSHHRNFHQEPMEDLSFDHSHCKCGSGMFFFFPAPKENLECSAVLIVDGVNSLSVFKSAAVS